MEPLVFIVFLTFAYFAGRLIALWKRGAQTHIDDQMASVARFFVEGGLIVAVFIAAVRRLTNT